jgi:hypothetical protein
MSYPEMSEPDAAADLPAQESLSEDRMIPFGERAMDKVRTLAARSPWEFES